MTGDEIFGPFLAMVLLTALVWVVMYVRRIGFLIEHHIDSQELTTPEKGVAIIPEQINWSAYNFRNLFELPVLFYALCLYLYVSGIVDSLFVWCAWSYVALRALHSLEHCFRNNVDRRFWIYMLSSVVLWSMFIRAGWQYVTG